jgi:Carboxypeptidase regulatory-like domain
MRSNFSFIRSFIFATLCLGATCVSQAQSDRGTVAGTVEDSSGGIVTDAEVTLKGADTASEYRALSGPTGGFRIPEVKIGIYTVTVKANGFKTDEKTGVQVQVNTVATVDFSLTIGDVKETLTVVADAPAVQSESSDIGTIVDSRQIKDLPLALNGTGQSHLRSVESFVFLTPGTVGPGTASDSSSSGIFESKIGGGQNLGTEVLLDGASISHAELGPSFDENAPSVEAISEFKVTTSTLPAQFGRTSGGIESFTTKSGQNSFHGSAFDILHNDKLNANSFFNNSVGAPKDRDHQNDFGGSLGGPVWIPKLYNGRDRTFFFFSWEQYRNNIGQTSRTTLPTDAERTGDFSALLGGPLMNGASPVINPCDNTPVLVGQIFDPATPSCPTGFVGGRIAFPGNKITNLSPVAQNMLSFLNAHADPALGLTNNFVFQSLNPQRDTTMTFRIDENWGINNKFFFSYSSRDQEQLNGAQSIPAPLDPNFFKSRFSHYVRFGWDRTLSSTLLNHLNIGFNRLHDPSKAQSINGTDWPAVLGIPNATGPVFPPITFNANNLNIGYQGLSGGNDDLAVPNSLIVADSVSWVKGSHTIRMGFEWRHSQFSRYNNLNTSPSYTFNGFQTAFAPGDQNTGDPFASFLLGLPQQESAHFSLHAPRWIQNYYVGFVQDDFKFRKNLTLNLGLRYEVDTPRHEAAGIQSVLDVTAPNPGAGGTPGALIYGPGATGAKTYYKDLGPRIGFAYAPERLFGRDALRNTVIRGGYGIYYSALFYTDFGDSMNDGTTVNPTFTSPNNFAPVSIGGAGSLDAGFPDFTPPSNAKDPSLLNGNFQGAPSFAAASNGRPGMVQNWSLEIQHQLAPDLILTVGYIGTHATRLNSNLQQLNAINPQFLPLGTKLSQCLNPDTTICPDGGVAGRATLAGVGVTSVPAWFTTLWGPTGQDLVGQLLLPFPQFLSGEQGGTGITTNCCLENLGQSTYNALEAKLERRFRNGLNLLASYTFSKTLTNADSAYAGLTAFGSSDTFLAQNPQNLKAEKALSYQDVPHAFVLSYLYELPVGKGKKFLNKDGVTDKILGGWQIGGVHRYQKGVPFIPFALGQTNPFGTANPRLSRVAGQPLLAPNHSSYNPREGGSGCTANNDGTFTASGTNNFFNCAAFFDPNAPGVVATNGFSFGDLPKSLGEVRSSGYMNEDFSVIKRVALFEGQALSFKVDFTNAFNRHTFGRGDGCVTCDTFGQPGSQFGGGPNILNGTKKIQLTFRYEF